MVKYFTCYLEVVLYLTECTLATVEKMAMEAKPRKGELRRQINIAQTGLQFIMHLNLKIPLKNRIKEVIESCAGNVEDWASDIKAQNKH